MSLQKQGYTHDACRSPAAVFTECAQFRARLSARPRKRVVAPPPRKRLSRELFTYWRGRGALPPPDPPGVVRLSRELFTYWRGRGALPPPDPPGVVRLSRELFTYWRGRGGSAPPGPPRVVRLSRVHLLARPGGLCPPGPPRSCQALVLNRFSTEMKH